MLFCWQDSAEDRPPFSDILRDLHRMLEDKDPAGKVRWFVKRNLVGKSGNRNKNREVESDVKNPNNFQP